MTKHKLTKQYIDEHDIVHDFNSWARAIVEAMHQAGRAELEKRGGEADSLTFEATLTLKPTARGCMEHCITIPIIDKEFCYHHYFPFPDTK